MVRRALGSACLHTRGLAASVLEIKDKEFLFDFICGLHNHGADNIMTDGMGHQDIHGQVKKRSAFMCKLLDNLP